MHGMERLKWIPNNNPPKCPTLIGPVGFVSGVSVGHLSSIPKTVRKKEVILYFPKKSLPCIQFVVQPPELYKKD